LLEREKQLAQVVRETVLPSPASVVGLVPSDTQMRELLIHACNFIDDKVPGVLSAILLLSSDRKRLSLAAGPRVPQQWNHTLEDLASFADASFNSTGGYPEKTVWIADLRSNGSFAACRALAGDQGYRSAWSVPIFGHDRATLGALVLFSQAKQAPVGRDLKVVGRAAQIAASAIEEVDSVRIADGSISLLPGSRRGEPVDSEFGEMIGASTVMQNLFSLIEKVSDQDCPVLILGETGTGKDLIARSIHDSGPRSSKAFVVVDCSSLVPSLVEAELFGYDKGAFTGAFHAKPGLMETANGGTVFLDEIGDLPIEMQSKLLRVLQEKVVRPIGSRGYVPVSARVVAATNRDLEEGVRQGTFREDLFFRLNVVQIRAPSLRERSSDIPALVNSFMAKFSKQGNKMRSISTEAMNCLTEYHWPGNVRQLANTIQRAIALGTDAILQVPDLPISVRCGVSDALPRHEEIVSLGESERRAIVNAIRSTDGHVATTARILRMGKSTLYRKLREYAVLR
jgi:DNA-binding NtrC family response regulator